MHENGPHKLQELREELSLLSDQAKEAAQNTSDSAAPELLEGLERLLGRIRHWEASVDTVQSGPERNQLLSEGQNMAKTLRRLPLSLGKT